jgi:hypothetical protein
VEHLGLVVPPVRQDLQVVRDLQVVQVRLVKTVILVVLVLSMISVQPPQKLILEVEPYD